MSSSGVTVLCSEPAATAFALAGLLVDAVPDAPTASSRLDVLLSREDIGVVLVQDDLWVRVLADVRRRAERATRPVVVPFPAPGVSPGVPAHEHIVEILRRAIGYRVHL